MATYTRQHLVGRGGMAEVWRGQMTTEGGATRTVALKFILPKLADDESLLSSFRSEAQLSMHLSHGNVVQVFDFGQLEGRWFLAMEWIDGTSLWKVLKKAKALGLGAVHPVMAAQVLMAVLDGLHHAHARTDAGKPLELVHRDVSPDNVLLSWDGQVKVADFGIARAALQGREETQPGIFKGKLAYGAPEQARGEAVDARADVYAAGVMLWELVTGHNPVAQNAVGIAAGRARIAAFDPLLVDGPFAALMNKAVAAEPDARLPSAKAFRDELGAWLRTQPATRMGPAELMAWLFPDHVSAPELKDVGAGTGQWLLRWKPKATQPKLEPEPVTTRIVAPEKAPPLRAVLGISIGVCLVVLALALLPRSTARAPTRQVPSAAAATPSPGPPPPVTELSVAPVPPAPPAPAIRETLPEPMSAGAPRPAEPVDCLAAGRRKIAALDFESAEALLSECKVGDVPSREAIVLLTAMKKEEPRRDALLAAERAIVRGDAVAALENLRAAESTELLVEKLDGVRGRIAGRPRPELAAVPIDGKAPEPAKPPSEPLSSSDHTSTDEMPARARLLVDEALALAKSGQLRAAKKKIDECRFVAPTSVRCVLLSGSIYAQLASAEGADPTLLKDARSFYEEFLILACPGHPSCSKVERYLGTTAQSREGVAAAAGATASVGDVDSNAKSRVGGANVPKVRLVDSWKDDINITAAEPTVTGALDKGLVHQVLKANRMQVQLCYATQLDRFPKLNGVVSVKFVITSAGSVGRSQVAGSTAHNSDLEACIANLVRTWAFPKPQSGGAVVTYPFSFKGVGT